MKEVNWMIESNLGLEWEVDVSLARVLKEGFCERWYWGPTWMMRRKQPCEDVGPSRQSEKQMQVPWDRNEFGSFVK